jgi:transcriptional regulator with XRE-family HTH domain
VGVTSGTKAANARRHAQAILNGRMAVDLRVKGWTLREIAEKFGYASQGAISELIKAELAVPAERAEELRVIETEKLDLSEQRLLKSIEKNKADPEHLTRLELALNRVRERRARLLNLDVERRIDPDLVVSTAAATAAATASQTVQQGPAVQIILSGEAKEEGPT